VDFDEINVRYVRMLKYPGLYGVSIDYREESGLVQKCTDIVHSAAIFT